MLGFTSLTLVSLLGLASSTLAAPTSTDNRCHHTPKTCVAPASPNPDEASICFTEYPSAGLTAGSHGFNLHWQGDESKLGQGVQWNLFVLESVNGSYNPTPTHSYEGIDSRTFFYQPEASAAPNTTIHFSLSTADNRFIIFTPTFPIYPSA